MKSIEELLESKGIIPERPPSLDAKGRRIDIFPAKVKGFFRTRRDLVYNLLLVLFLIVPWTQFAGKQTIHLDLWNKKFTFFGVTLLAHEGPLIFFIFGIVIFSLLLATALYGRVWCGWACPQTVFIDGVFRKIEEWVEGNHIQRKKLAKEKYTKKKLLKKIVKWTLFLIISSHIAHSFLAYFLGAKSLFWTTWEGPNGQISFFVFVQIFTILIAINFGWFKEQFCLVACPYGRFQSALMDQNSTTVIYDHKRGEPRRESKDKAYMDCVNCFKCVSVCPTGIDIRDGQQLECIGCTACIDACDSVMLKLNKPKGLIRYASEAEVESGENYVKPRNLRALFYALGLVVMLSLLSFFIYSRQEVSVKLIRAADSPYQVSASPEGDVITNHFKIHLVNQSEKVITDLSFSVNEESVKVITPQISSKIEEGGQNWMHVFLRVSKTEFQKGLSSIQWRLNYQLNKDGEKVGQTKKGKLKLLGPDK